MCNWVFFNNRLGFRFIIQWSVALTVINQLMGNVIGMMRNNVDLCFNAN